MKSELDFKIKKNMVSTFKYHPVLRSCFYNDEQKFLRTYSHSPDIRQEGRALCITRTQERWPAEEMSRTMFCQGFL